MARRANQRTRGAVRDRKTGVMLGRSAQHPLSSLFTAVPNSSVDYPDADLPPFNPPEEFKHILAIHIFDNLYPGLPAPAAPGTEWHLVGSDGAAVVDGRGQPVVVGAAKYRLVNPTGDRMPMGGNGEMWLPWSTPAEAVAPAVVMADPDGVPDVNELSEAQLVALEQQIEQRRIDEARAREADVDVAPSDPGWVQWRQERAERLQAKQAAASGPVEVVPEADGEGAP